MKKLKIFIIVVILLIGVFGLILLSNPIQTKDSKLIISTLPNVRLVDSGPLLSFSGLVGQPIHTYHNGDFEFNSGREMYIIDEFEYDVATDYLAKLFLHYEKDINKIAEKYNITLLNYEDYTIDIFNPLYVHDLYYLTENGEEEAYTKHSQLYNILCQNPNGFVILYRLGDYQNAYPNLSFYAYLNNYSQCESVYNFIYDLYALSEKYFPIENDENVDFTVEDEWCDIDIYLKSFNYKETLSYFELTCVDPGKNIANLSLSFNRSTFDYLRKDKATIIGDFQSNYIDLIHKGELLGDDYMSYDKAITYPTLVLTENEVYVNGVNPDYNIFDEFKYDISSEEYKYEFGFYPLDINVPTFEHFLQWIYPNNRNNWVNENHFKYDINGDIYEIKKELVSEERFPDEDFTLGLYHYNIYFYKNGLPLELSVNTMNIPHSFYISLNDFCLLLNLKIEKIEPNAIYLNYID